jgi:hypothetical protein
MSDSLEIIATGEGEKRLSIVLSLCVCRENNKAAFERWVRYNGGLSFPDRGGIEFPVPIDGEQAAKMAIEVLAKQNDWPSQPDIDGHCERGWRVESDWTGTKVLPFWMIYHK